MQPTEFYKPASGPAYATATNVDELGLGQTRRQLDIGPGPQFADIPFPPAERGPDVPADQRSLEAAVIAGANAYKPDVRRWREREQCCHVAMLPCSRIAKGHIVSGILFGKL